MVLVRLAGVVVVEIDVFLAYLVCRVCAGLTLVLLVKNLDSKVAEKALGFRAWLILAELLAKVEDVLRQAHDRDAGATARLLEEVIPARAEILHFVLPEKDRVWRLLKVSPKPCPLEDQLEHDVDQSARSHVRTQARENRR